MNDYKKIGISLLIAVSLLIMNSNVIIDQAQAQSNNNGVKINKLSLGKLGEEYWRWAFSLDTSVISQKYNIPIDQANPFYDTTGLLCDVGRQPDGSIFLVGTAGVFGPTGLIQPDLTTYDRTCANPIKQSSLILIPLVNVECSTVEYGMGHPCGQTNGELRESAQEFIDRATNLVLKVDGVPLEISQHNRAFSQGNGFDFTINENNVFGLTAPSDLLIGVNQLPVTTHAISDGYYAVLQNLPPGPHTIEFGGQINLPGDEDAPQGYTFITYATYHITIAQ